MITSSFEEKHLKLMNKGISLFNNQEYWECHEELEGHWLEARGDNLRNVYWAVIQVAAAMVHYENGNEIGAQGLLKKSQEKFLRVESFQIENELMNKFLDWSKLKRMVFELNENSPLSHFQKLYEFRFTSYPEEFL